MIEKHYGRCEKCGDSTGINAQLRCDFCRVTIKDVYHIAQMILTGLNVSNIEKESAIHKELRKTMIGYREDNPGYMKELAAMEIVNGVKKPENF